jgi:hypothetical protein
MSSIVDIPVEIIRGNLYLAAFHKRFILVKSHDDSLILLTLKSSTRNFKLSSSKGVEINSIPMSSLYFFNSKKSFFDNSSFFISSY